MQIAAIPTTYRNVRFRSRLEARWAAMFDQLGWEWDYEPIDLDGYIPDFVLRFKKPLLVEVKPEFDCDGLEKHTQKIDDSGWEGEALLVGARHVANRTSDKVWCGYDIMIGLMRDRWHNRWNNAFWVRCQFCDLPSLWNRQDCWCCRVCESPGKEFAKKVDFDIESMWAIAGNEVQWKGR